MKYTRLVSAILAVTLPLLCFPQTSGDRFINEIVLPSGYTSIGKPSLARDNRRSDYDGRQYRFSFHHKEKQASVSVSIAFGDFSKLPTKMGRPLGDKLGVSRVDWQRGLPSRANFEGDAIYSKLNAVKANGYTIIVGDELCAVVVSFVANKPNDAKVPAEALALHFHSEVRRLFRVTGTGENRRVVPR
jgi:hypothetical protein